MNRGSTPVIAWSWFRWALAIVLMLAATGVQARGEMTEVELRILPREAQETIALIRRGGPFPYERDGIVFGNRERQLPPRPRGYYREFTVSTPGIRHRGARRIVSGSGLDEFYYTEDHYRSFRRVRIGDAATVIPDGKRQ